MFDEVLIDARPLQGGSRFRGVGSYVRGLLEGFAELSPPVFPELLAKKGGMAPDLGGLGHDYRVFRAVPSMKRRLTPVLDPFVIDYLLRRCKPALYHATEYGQPITNPVPIVITVHDMIPFIFPKMYPWLRREREFARRLFKRADAVIVPSQSAAEDVMRYAKVPEARITVISEAAAAQFRPAAPDQIAEVKAKYLIDKPYFLALGTLSDPRKQVSHALTVAEKLKESGVKFVLAGDQGNGTARVKKLVEARELEDDVILTGYLPGPDLPPLISGAEMVVHPAAYEGFGLPVLEAMACGTPVIAYRNSSLPEVAGEAAMLVDNGDRQALAWAASELVADLSLRQRLSVLGRQQAMKFSWRRAAEETLGVYQRVVR